MYTDENGTFFGRVNDEGNIDILHIEDGLPATRLDATIYPVGGDVSARYEHPEGIALTKEDADFLGIEIE